MAFVGVRSRATVQDNLNALLEWRNDPNGPGRADDVPNRAGFDAIRSKLFYNIMLIVLYGEPARVPIATRLTDFQAAIRDAQAAR